jgi:hypothetical protein
VPTCLLASANDKQGVAGVFRAQMFPLIAKITTQKIRIENRMMAQAQTDASSISIVGR